MSQVSASIPIAPGFSDAVIDSQEAFRCILAALSRPGRIESIRRLPDCPPAMASVTAAIALTLFDFDTPVWLDPAAGDIGSELFLRFHCGCAVTDRPEQARFAIVGDALNMPRLAAFHPGDALYPDRSATVIVQLAEGPHLTSNLVDVAVDDIEIGMPVEVVLVAVSDEVTLPLFRRA